ncbi:hypothetical protein LZC95_45380 [Pendulispora brunnea]|uniref:Uncharacterized protein n=1 Tax=Pendulispora brunnea TaxID=2905690 RepID=A0ABZ2K4P1_9BACT
MRAASGEVRCFGSNENGKLGRGSFTGERDSSPAPVALPAGKTATQITTSVSHACAIVDDGSVWCWGRNQWGALGAGHSDGTKMDLPESSTPVMVQGLSTGALYVSAGIDFTCATLADRSVMCWGANHLGQLGRGNVDDKSPHPEPARVSF